MTAQRWTYRKAGVDIDAGNEAVRLLAPLAAATRRPGVLGGIGGFGGLFAVPPRLKRPVLVASTDGVGTKLKLAFALGRHDTVGIDLVAMSVNDFLFQGAEPLFFLDYSPAPATPGPLADWSRGQRRLPARPGARCSAARRPSCPISTSPGSTTSPASPSASSSASVSSAAAASARATW